MIIQRNFEILKLLETPGVGPGPAASPMVSASRGDLLEIEHLTPHPRATGSESAFRQATWVTGVCTQA